MSPSVVDTIKMDATAFHRHHHHRLAGIYEFRLQSSKDDERTVIADAATSSICSEQLSMHKQRIDSMFDETRSSVVSGTHSIRRGRVLLDDLEEEDEEEEEENGEEEKTRNTVQERIQKMFADVTEDEGKGAEEGRRKQSKGFSPGDTNDLSASAEKQRFPVHYLGSAPLPDRDATLQALQSPLKTLYFRYRKLEMRERAPPLDGTLEISAKGMRVKVQAEEGPTRKETDKLNKFPSIAVWAAVKFVSKDLNSGNDEESARYAFLPLIADPDGTDKSELFRPLPDEDCNYSRGPHSPLFAVVMRRSSRSSGASKTVEKSLHCHAFVCACSEDAIVMAANLYRALVEGMSAGKRKSSPDDEPKQSLRQSQNTTVPNRPRQIERASSLDGGARIQGVRPASRISGVLSSASAPVRPPRRKKGPSRHGDDAHSTNSEDLFSLEEEEEEEETTLGEPPSKEPSALVSPSIQSKLAIAPKDPTGDIFTRVAIPRSGSFLDHGAAIRRSSSMGLGDLFQEVRAQEGLTSLDAILENIVDADGMSFARLKPLYREFLLKLAATLSRDELYQRSKSIMRRQASSRRRRRLRRRASGSTPAVSSDSKREEPQGGEDSASGEGGNKGGRFSWALCKSKTKGKGSSSVTLCRRNKAQNGERKGEDDSYSKRGGTDGTSCNFEFTSVIFPSEGKARERSSSASSSLSSRASKSRRQKRKQFHAHRPSFNAGRSVRGPRTQPTGVRGDSDVRPRVSTSEDSSDFFSFKRRSNNVDTNTKSSTGFGSCVGGRCSSGYISCSDCSFDTESCDSDKCYCPQEPQKRHRSNGSRRKESSRCGEEQKKRCRRAEKCRCETGRLYCPCRGRGGSTRGFASRGCSRDSRTASSLSGCRNHAASGASYRRNSCRGSRRCGGCVGAVSSRTGNFGKTKAECRRGGVEGRDRCSECDWEKENTFNWEDEAILLEDGASATSSSSWRAVPAVPKSRMEVYATCRPLEGPASADEDAYGGYSDKKREKVCRPRPCSEESATKDGKKVLVVSARDPKGRLICMGRGDQANDYQDSGESHPRTPTAQHQHQQAKSNAASDALSVKKSAEMAALFSSDSRSYRAKETTGGEEVATYTTIELLQRTSNRRSSTRKVDHIRGAYYMGNTLENTLGYLP